MKVRIAKLEKMGMLLKEGVKLIQTDRCSCVETAAKIRMTMAEMDDSDGNMTNRFIIRSSKRCRNQSDHNSISSMGSSEDEAFAADPLASSPPRPIAVQEVAKIIKIPGRAELSVTPLADGSTVVKPVLPASKTAQEAINDTIIRCLKQEKPIPPPISVGGALNLVKIATSNPTTPISISTPPPLVLNSIRPSPLPTVITPSAAVAGAKQIVVLPAATRATTRTREPSVSSIISLDEPIKCEPEIQIVECEPPRSSAAVNGAEEMMEEGVDPTVSCVAAAQGYRDACGGELNDLEKLTNYLDLVTKSVSRDNGTAAMERQLLKSRLKIPFWKADEVCGSNLKLF